MSYYAGVHSCGHEGGIELVGTKSYKEWRAKQYFSDMCPECLKKKHEERAKRIEEEYDMPKLTGGTEKQINWANIIRADFLDYCEKEKLVADYIINAKTDAKFWIDNRDELFANKCIYRWNSKIKRELEGKEVLDESTITYHHKYKENTVEIDGVLVKESNQYCIGLEYKKSNNFIDLVKNEGYHWSGETNVWYKEVKNEEGWRAEAERIGVILFREGYGIRIFDKELLEKLRSEV